MSLVVSVFDVMGFKATRADGVTPTDEPPAGLIPLPVEFKVLLRVDLLSVLAHALSTSAVITTEMRPNLAISGVIFIEICFSIRVGWQKLVRHPGLRSERHALELTDERTFLDYVKRG